MKLLDKLKLKRLNINKLWHDEIEEYEWLMNQWEEPGFKSYIYVRDLSIMKSIAEAVSAKDFYTALKLSGRREELIKLADDAKNLSENNE